MMLKLSMVSMRWAAALLLCMLAGGVGAQTVEVPTAPAVGDKWTYRFHNKGDKREPYLYSLQVKAVDGDSAWIYGESKEPNARYPRYVWRHEVRSSENVERFEFDESAPNTAGKRIVDRTKLDRWFQFPMAVGKQYTIKRNWDNGRGFDELKAEVQALEKVKVDGGEFEAYRIRFSGFWNQREGGVYSGRSENTVWYAPSVRGIVKWLYTNRTSNGGPWNDMVTELVKWEPGAGN